MNSDRTSNSSIEENILDYYLLLKFRIDSKNLNLTAKQIKNNEKFKTIKENFKQNNNLSTEMIQIFNYLKEMIEIYSNIKCEIKETEYNDIKNDHVANFQQQNYENLIRKLECDLRNHMKAEFELKLQIEYLDEQINNHRKENKNLNEKIKSYSERYGSNDISSLKNEIKNLKEITKQLQSENIRKEKESNDIILDLKKKVYDLEELLKSFNNAKLNNYTKNNFFYSVNNINNGNVILNNIQSTNNNSSMGQIKISDTDFNSSNGNHDKFEKINNNNNKTKFQMMHKRSSSSINNYIHPIETKSRSPNIKNQLKTKLKIIQSNFLDTNYSKMEKLMIKNLSNSKNRQNTKDLIIEEDPLVFNSESIIKGPQNLNIRKYMQNTFNKTKIIARNSSGIL